MPTQCTHVITVLSKMASNSSDLRLSCSVCSSPFSDPRLLPCLHVFCKSCLDPLYSQNEEGTLACPTCYDINTCPSPYQLPRHLRIEREVTQYKLHQQTRENEVICQSCDYNKKAEAYCKDCVSPICADCKKNHEVMKVLKKHSVVSLTESQSTASVQRVPCIFHPDEYVKYYCSSCSCLLCGNECLFNHKEHYCYHIVEEDLVKKEKDEIQGLLPRIEEVIPLLTQASDRIGGDIEKTQTNKNHAVKDIKSVFNRISEAVEKRCTDLIKEVSEIALAKSTQLEMQNESIKKLSAGLKLAFKEGNVAINDCSDVEVLAVKGSIVKASNELLKENKFTNCDPVCGSSLGVAIDSSEVLGLISHLGNVLMSPNVSTSTSSLVDCPQTITVCKSSECSVTLQTRDSKGNELTEGGATVTGTLLNTCGQSESYQCRVKDIENGQYEIMLDTSKEGQFTLHVSVDNTIISDSPLTVNVRDYPTFEEKKKEANRVYVDTSKLSYAIFGMVDSDSDDGGCSGGCFGADIDFAAETDQEKMYNLIVGGHISAEQLNEQQQTTSLSTSTDTMYEDHIKEKHRIPDKHESYPVEQETSASLYQPVLKVKHTWVRDRHPRTFQSTPKDTVCDELDGRCNYHVATNYEELGDEEVIDSEESISHVSPVNEEKPKPSSFKIHGSGNIISNISQHQTGNFPCAKPRHSKKKLKPVNFTLPSQTGGQSIKLQNKSRGNTNWWSSLKE